MKKQGEKCQDRGEKERGWKKGWPKSKKCHGTVGKYVGERIGGYLGVPRDGSHRRTSIELDQSTYPKKVRGQTTRDKRGEHARQEDKNNRAGVQGHKPRRKGVRTVQNGLVGVDLLGGQRLPASGGRKKGNIQKWEVPDTSGRARRRRSIRIRSEIDKYCTAVPSSSPKGPTQKNLQKKNKLWLGTRLGRAI
jgi:hypothetical protein